MSIEMLRDANPVPPEQTAGSVHEERAQRLLASILAEAPSRSLYERLRTLFSPRLVRVVAVAAALALVALTFSVTLPFGGGGGGGVAKLTLLDRAAAALPINGPVVHVVWRQADVSSSSAKLVIRYEEWFDSAGKIDHQIARKGSKVLDYWRVSGKGYLVKNTLIGPDSIAYMYNAFMPSQLVGMIKDYRKALDRGEIVLIRRGVAYGTPVYWVKFRCSTALALSPGLNPDRSFLCQERIGLDRRSFLPVAEEVHLFKQIWQWNGDHTEWHWTTTNEQSDTVMTSDTGVPLRTHILKIEMISRAQADLRPPAKSRAG